MSARISCRHFIRELTARQAVDLAWSALPAFCVLEESLEITVRDFLGA
jgi:hypothetical protein